MPLPCPKLLGSRQFQVHANRKFSTLKTVSSELLSANRKIAELIRCGMFEDARSVFDKMPQKSTLTWNSMLSGYVHRREIAKARKLFDEMPDRDVVSWNLMIAGYTSCRGRSYLEEGQHLFDKMPKRDFVSWNTLISGYANHNLMEDALKLFDTMPMKDVVTWNAMITGFLNSGNAGRAFEFFQRMPRRDASSLCAFVSGLIRNDELNWAERVLFEYGEMGDGKTEDLVSAYNTLVAGYGRRGKIENARHIFDQMRFKRNVVTWNSMIMSYVRVRDVASARDLFNRMEDRDTVTWNTMISGYVRAPDMEEATRLFNKMAAPDAFTWNTMISGFAKAGKMEVALEFFDRMPHKTRVSWNTIVAGFEMQSDFQAAVKVFINMQAGGEKPDRHTLSSLLSVCAESAARHLGMQIHQLVTKLVIPDLALNNSLITMYARCGAILEAKAVFDEMRFEKDVISWNAVIGAYASHGFARDAIKLFETMKSCKVRPTHITFVSVLSACAHGGLVEEGKSYFASMVHDFGIEPRVEHFASLVDVVGRCGKVEEAVAIIESLPIEADKAVWGALMNACRMHDNVEVGKIAAESLMRLEPGSSGPFVSLYNMYADEGRWKDADDIRVTMEKNNIRKERGYSRVDSDCSK